MYSVLHRLFSIFCTIPSGICCKFRCTRPQSCFRLEGTAVVVNFQSNCSQDFENSAHLTIPLQCLCTSSASFSEMLSIGICPPCKFTVQCYSFIFYLYFLRYHLNQKSNNILPLLESRPWELFLRIYPFQIVVSGK